MDDERHTDAVRPGALRVAFVLATAAAAACSPSASKGTMPPPGPGGIVDASAAPDFIAVAGRGSGIAGYARREDVLGIGGEPFPVYGDDLRTVVGQMVPGKGFIPVGTDPNAVPRIPVVAGPASQLPSDTSKVVLYVRNDSPGTIHTAIVIEGIVTAGGGFSGHEMGVECDSMPVAAQLVLLDRSATNPGATVQDVLYTRGAEPNPPSLWIVVGNGGTTTHGFGVPAWWGPAQAC